MGLTESKVPFEADGNPSTPKSNEIGICASWDPRSPSVDFDRTPVLDRNEGNKLRNENISVVVGDELEDPRSPSKEITRTPVNVEFKKSTDGDIDSELRIQLERLHIFDDGVPEMTENLGNASESTDALMQQKTVLKLLDDESVLNTMDSLWVPDRPPCPKSQSTPKESILSSPETPECCKRETDDLIKRRKPSKKSSSQKTEKLQKKVLKKTLTEQVSRSPLAERNGMVVKEGKAASKAKSTAFVKYRKYNSLDESFDDSFLGKENEQIVW